MFSIETIREICAPYEIAFDGVREIKDTSRGETDRRYACFLDERYVLKLTNAPHMHEERLYEIAGLIERYRATGLYAPLDLKKTVVAHLGVFASKYTGVELTEQRSMWSIIDLVALKERLREQVKHSVTRDRAAWETGYICKPSQFFSSRASIFYTDNRAIAQYECDFIKRTQLDDGSWPIPWSWNDYPEAWAVSKNWWKSNGAILNLLYLKGMGAI